MRRALQVGSPGSASATRDQGADARGTRRFAQNGDVPVTRLTGRKDHPSNLALTVAEDALRAERVVREQVEAALAQANATIVTLQTKLAHAEMAHAEALSAERALQDARQAQRVVFEEAKTRPPTATPTADIASEIEPEPVQWWVPGWKGAYRGP